jgi:hypothetical protein
LAEESDDDLNSESDSDCEAAAMAIAETEEVFADAYTSTRRAEKGVAIGDDASVPPEGVFVNWVSGAAHMVKSGFDDRSACGLIMNPITYVFSQDPDALMGCSLCWRAGCANWSEVETAMQSQGVPSDCDSLPADDDGFDGPAPTP